MKTTRAILTGTIVWSLGVSAFIGSFYLPLLEDQELQANLALAISLVPFAWFGAKFYYINHSQTPGYKLAFTMVAIAVILDAIITVPLLVIPAGGSHEAFFSAPSFWLIALEYFLVVLSYWNLRVRPAAERSFN